MINLQYVAEAFNKLLGTNDYIVYLDTNFTPQENDTSRTLCVMTASRNPQALGGAIDSETLTLSFAFDIRITDREEAAKRKAGIASILGWRSFQITTPEDEVYDINSWVDLSPAEPARVDEGEFMQILPANGTALVSNHSVGATVSNRIRTYINDEEVTVMSYTSALVKGTDELVDLSDDDYQIEPQEISRTNTADITILYTGSEIDNYFRTLIESGTDSAGNEQMNKTYEVARSYPDTTITNTMALTEATTIAQAGAYMYYKLTFRKVGGGGSIEAANGVRSVKISGASALAIGANGKYTALVKYYGAESDDDVIWDTSELPSFCAASVDTDGTLTVINNSPKSGVAIKTATCYITAKSRENNSVTDKIAVTITYYTTVVSVAISKTFSGTYVKLDTSVQLVGVVTYNDGAISYGVTWSVALSEGKGVTINSAGRLTNNSTNGGNDIEVTVTATANDDTTKTATLVLTCEGGESEYTIYYTDGAHSSVSGPTTARAGSSVTVEGEADENYTITNISARVGDEVIAKVEDGDILTFEMPDSNVTITVTDTDY